MYETSHSGTASGQSFRDLVIGVVTGGVSEERDRSLLSGRAVYESLSSRGHEARILDAADSDFTDQVRKVDVAFLAIAGQYAEDGKLQGLLEILRIPYTGSGVLASALGMNKTVVKTFVASLGVPVLGHMEIDLKDTPETVSKQVTESIGFPVMLKPVSEGGSVGMSIAGTPTELQAYIELIDDPSSNELFAERYCSGKSLTVGVLDGPAGLQALPALEAKSVGDFYDYETKRNPALHRYECPADLDPGVRAQISRNAITVHKELGCIGYSRSDFIVDESGKGYFLEVNTLPGLSRTGNLATMAKAQGIEYDDLVQFILSSAFARDGYVA